LVSLPFRTAKHLEGQMQLVSGKKNVVTSKEQQKVGKIAIQV
jgi:hypothetical protein